MPAKEPQTVDKHLLTFPSGLPLIVSDIKLDTAFSQTPNYHDYLEVSYIAEGEGVFHTAHRGYRVSAGDLILIGADEFHFAEAARASSMVIRCVFFLPRAVCPPGHNGVELQFLAPFYNHGSQFSNLIPGASRTGREVVASMDDMVRAYRSSENDKWLTIKARLLDMLLLVSRHYRGHRTLGPARTSRQQTHQRLRPVFAHVHNNYASHLTVDELAKTAAMSPDYLSRYFKKTTGMSLTSYINRFRVDKAKELLIADRLGNSRIGATVGFESESYFYRTFRRITGTTPQKFRETFRK